MSQMWDVRCTMYDFRLAIADCRFERGNTDCHDDYDQYLSESSVQSAFAVLPFHRTSYIVNRTCYSLSSTFVTPPLMANFMASVELMLVMARTRPRGRRYTLPAME
jgi:hypothetical protein